MKEFVLGVILTLSSTFCINGQPRALQDLVYFSLRFSNIDTFTNQKYTSKESFSKYDFLTHTGDSLNQKSDSLYYDVYKDDKGRVIKVDEISKNQDNSNRSYFFIDKGYVNYGVCYQYYYRTRKKENMETCRKIYTTNTQQINNMWFISKQFEVI